MGFIKYSILNSRLGALSYVKDEKLFQGITRGIEKENLRITPEGKISTKPHPSSLGSPLTNPWVTTDFSESLIEVVTPPEKETDLTYQQLKQISQFVAQNINDELIWPASMPPEIVSDSCIPLADYGQNNVGRMKKLYRKGLCYRYGRAMQVIAGIHYNFSLPEGVFEVLRVHEAPDQSFYNYKNDAYMRLVRNCLRYAWVIPYLFGASPICSESSLIKSVDYMKNLRSKTWYGEYATSLRLGDLGYQNNGLNLLKISYENVESYAASLVKATQTPFQVYQQIGVQDKTGNDQQISDAVLQIANEYYIPIRPKQPAYSGERPTTALEKRGIAYVEMRMLDLNPLQPIGICPEQMAFMDVYLTFCALQQDVGFSQDQLKIDRENIRRVAVAGRDPQLKLNIDSKLKPFQVAAKHLFENLQQVAELLSESCEDQRFIEAVENQFKTINDSRLTPSFKLLNNLKESQKTFQEFHLEKAYEHTQLLQAEKPSMQPLFEDEAAKSLKAFSTIESQPQQPFDEFLAHYFES